MACRYRRRALAPGDQAPAQRSVPGREAVPAELAGARLRHRPGLLPDGEPGRSCGIPAELLLGAVAAHWRTAAGTHHREGTDRRSEEHTSELQSLRHLVC